MSVFMGDQNVQYFDRSIILKKNYSCFFYLQTVTSKEPSADAVGTVYSPKFCPQCTRLTDSNIYNDSSNAYDVI